MGGTLLLSICPSVSEPLWTQPVFCGIYCGVPEDESLPWGCCFSHHPAEPSVFCLEITRVQGISFTSDSTS